MFCLPSPLRLWWFPRFGRWRPCRAGIGVHRAPRAALAASLLLMSACLWLLPLAGPLMAASLLAGQPAPAVAAPGLCVGPVCGDEFSRSAKHVFQLRLRLRDQRGQQERITVDCRDGHISPATGPVERGYGAAVARRACRLVGGTPS